MTRQAAPPAQRWLLLVVVLLAPWLGQGVAAGAASMGVDPLSGGPGTTVNVTLTDFLDACIVLFDSEVVAIGEGCASTTLSFTVPSSASEGDHEIRAVGQAGEETAEEVTTFRVTSGTASPASTTAPGEIPPSTLTTTASAVTTRPGASPTGPPGTAAPASVPAPPPRSAAACPRGQVALMRFDLQPTRDDAGASVSAGTTWGSVGTCTEVRPLLVLFDGEPLAGQPPVAGTSGFFRITIPDNATTGRHQVTLVAADDESVELWSLTFEVVGAVESTLPLIVGAAIGAALLVLVVVLLIRRRRRRRRRPPPAPLDRVVRDNDLIEGSVDVPDIAGPGADTRPGAAHVPVPVPAVAADDDPTMPVVPLVVASGRDGSYYLLERQNANAPRAGDGKRGWYRAHRPSAIRGIVVRAAEAHTAGAVASELAFGAKPASAHVVVDVDGALELLPDDIVALHDPDLDDGALIMLLAGFGTDPVDDEAILSHAVAWSASKIRAHGIPARRVTPEEFRTGGSGILSDDAEFPWHRMRTLVEQPAGMVDLTALLDLPPVPEDVAPPVPPAAPAKADAAAAPAQVDVPVAPVPPAPPAAADAAVVVAGADHAPVAAEPSTPHSDEPAEQVGFPGVPTTWGAAPAASEVPPVVPTGPPPPGVPDIPPPAVPAVPPEGQDVPAPVALSDPSPPTPPERVDVPGAAGAADLPDLPATPALPWRLGSPFADLLPPLPPPTDPAALAPPFPVTEVAAPHPPPPPPPPPPVRVESAPPPAVRPPRPPRERRPLPTPDELIARTSGTVEYFLLEHENPHGTLRANGKHGWYYPTRYGGIRAVVLHSIGGDIDTAEEVAAHLAAVDQPEAAHAAIDPDTIIDLLPDETTALHGVRSSSAALDLAVVYDPAGWGTDPAAEEALLVRAAAWAGVRAVRHRIPVRRITVDDWHAGQRGFVARGDVDPGADFPWNRFLQLTGWVARRVAASQPPATQPPAAGPSSTGPTETVRSGNPPT